MSQDRPAILRVPHKEEMAECLALLYELKDEVRQLTLAVNHITRQYARLSAVCPLLQPDIFPERRDNPTEQQT